jgi:hypothetical protein
LLRYLSLAALSATAVTTAVAFPFFVNRNIEAQDAANAQLGACEQKYNYSEEQCYEGPLFNTNPGNTQGEELYGDTMIFLGSFFGAGFLADNVISRRRQETPEA